MTSIDAARLGPEPVTVLGIKREVAKQLKFGAQRDSIRPSYHNWNLFQLMLTWKCWTFSNQARFCFLLSWFHPIPFWLPPFLISLGAWCFHGLCDVFDVSIYILWLLWLCSVPVWTEVFYFRTETLAGWQGWGVVAAVLNTVIFHEGSRLKAGARDSNPWECISHIQAFSFS